MQPNLHRLSRKAMIIILLAACQSRGQTQAPGKQAGRDPAKNETATAVSDADPSRKPNPYPNIGAIPAPAGYHRPITDPDSFAAWLRKIPLKKDPTVYLYDGTPKNNQDAQFAVLDISVGHQDLQQCADAVMRLRAEYLYARNELAAIDFTTESGIHLNYLAWKQGHRYRLSAGRLVAFLEEEKSRPEREEFMRYLDIVFTYCGTRSLEKQLIPVTRFTGIKPGDVLIRGGSPGHAMTVVDMATDAEGRRIYLLAQGYMPAQDIHVVKNPSDPEISPWYQAEDVTGPIETPEWTFYINQLRTWR